MTEIQMAFCTAENAASGSKLAHDLLAARLVACVNLVPGIQSLYWWQGKIESSTEVLMVMKTTADRIAELKAFISKHHGYETPELLVMPVTDGLNRYLDWVQKETRPLVTGAGSSCPDDQT